MNMILRLQEAGAIPTLAEEIEVESLGPESQFIVSGQAAMDWLAGSNQLVAIWEAAGEDRNFKIMPVPRAAGGKQGLAIRPSQLEAVTVHFENPEWAAMFLDFFVNDVEANKVLNAERGVPINTVVLEVARQIYARRPLPIVLLTAYGDRELIEQATDLTIMACLMKPVNEQELLTTLQVVLARFEEQQQVLRHAVGLEEQLATRKLVDRAKGVLMQQEGLSEEDAYRRIQSRARQERRSMRQVAEAILRQAHD